MARKRRRLVPLGVLLLLLVCWQGFSHLQGDGEPGDRGQGSGEAATNPDSEATPASPGRGSGAAGGGTGPAKPGAAPARPFDEDSARALYGLAQGVAASGRFGDGFRALDELVAMAPPPAWQSRLVEARSDLGGQLTAAIQHAVEELRSGRVLGTRAALLALLSPPHNAVDKALGEVWPERWPSPRMTEPAERADMPAPRPLPARQAVLWYRDGSTVRGQVVSGGWEEVTLKIEGERGVTFPNARRLDLEPVGGGAEERLGQCLVAIASEDWLLARLWLSAALDAGADDERCAAALKFLR